MTEETNTPVTATEVPENQRAAFIPGLLMGFSPIACMELEGAVFDTMRQLWTPYAGGYWEFVKLSNGGGYMYLKDMPRPKDEPGDPSKARLLSLNGSDEDVSPRAAGLCATLCALNMMTWNHHERGNLKLAERYTDLFYQLREYARQETESDDKTWAEDMLAVFRLID